MQIHESIPLRFDHRVHFTRDALDPANPVLARCVKPATGAPARVLAFVDTHVARAMPDLPERLRTYAAAHADRMALAGRVQPVIGGEACKNDRDAMYRVLNAIDEARIDRQSYVMVIGGGAVLDCVGFAAAVAHRGVRLVRLPTTTLAQADSGVGVKNGINGFGKKNFLGSFAVPWAVVNDERFLDTLPEREWRCGFAEAVKVALLKDAEFFAAIEAAAPRICKRNMGTAAPLIARSAALHAEHIARGGDPFELTTARPLDFGHWAAHKLEAMSDYTVRHGEAVALGLALDCTYARRAGLLGDDDHRRVLALLRMLGFTLWHDALADHATLLAGLDEFREHLGGELTITLIEGVGRPINVHAIDAALMRASLDELAGLAVGSSRG